MKGKGRPGGYIGLDVGGRFCKQDNTCILEGMEVTPVCCCYVNGIWARRYIFLYLPSG